MVADSNSNALDAGVDCAIVLFDLCDSQSILSFAECVVKSVIDKCFSARSSTQSKGKQLVLKIMEISDPSVSCFALIEKFNDKRPKIPPLCIETIVEGIALFGASCFPLKELLKSIQPVFNSSNNAARDQAMAFVTQIVKWVGTAPILPMLENLRPAQKTEIEKCISEMDLRLKPIPSLFLRKDRENGINNAEPSSLKQSAKTGGMDGLDLIDEVDLAKKLKSGEFSELMKSEKWVEQSQGLQLIIDAIGPTPKLKPWAMTADIVKGCKEYMSWGHLQVQSKALKLLTLFSLGLKGKFAVEGRGIMPFVLMKAKEKKVVDDVEEACISMFKNSFSADPFVEDICEQLKSKKSPTHAKICMQRIMRQIIEATSLQVENIRLMLDTMSNCIDDSDPKVRESTVQVIGALHHFSSTGSGGNSREVSSIFHQYQTSRPKLFAKIVAFDSSAANESSTTKPVAVVAVSKPVSGVGSARSTSTKPSNVEAQISKPAATAAGVIGSKKTLATKGAKEDKIDIALNVDIVEAFGVSSDRVEQLVEAALGEEATSIKTGITDAKWQSKVEAMAALSKHVTATEQIDGETLKSILLFVAGATTKFRISNMNVVKAAMELCAIVCSKTADKIVVAVVLDTFSDKFSDKKMVPCCEEILKSCIASIGPAFVFSRLTAQFESIKAPLAHQNMLGWMKQYISQSGPQGLNLNVVTSFLVKELENKQGAVRSAAIEVLAEMFHYLGTPFQAMVNGFDIPGPAKSSIEAEFSKIGYDSTLSKKVAQATGQNYSEGATIPRVDLSTTLDKNLLNDMSSTEGKDSWQVRKSSIEKVSQACETSHFYVEMNRFIPDLLKSLKARFLDTQSNLRPLALSTLAKVIISLDDEAAIKAIRASVGSVLGSVSDSKKVIKDAAIAALETMVSGTENKPKSANLQCMIPALSEWLMTSPARGDVLLWLHDHIDCFLGSDVTEMTPCLVESLQDKNSIARTNAESLLCNFMQHGMINAIILDKSVRDLPTATKKSIQPFIDRVLAASRITKAPAVVASATEAVVPKATNSQGVLPQQILRGGQMQPLEQQREVNVVPKFVPKETEAKDRPSSSPTLPSVSAGSKQDRLRDYPPSSKVDDRLCEDWFHGDKTDSSQALFGTIMADEAAQLLVQWVHDPRFVHQSDLMFRWLGLQFDRNLLHGEIFDRYLHQVTLFMDGLRSLPKSIKMQLDSREIFYFLPKLMQFCKNLTDLQRQNYGSIVSCCSDCFPTASIAMCLLDGLVSPHIDCRRLCLNEILRLIDNSGFIALGNDALRKLSGQWSRIQKADPSFPLFQRLALSLAESVEYDARKLANSFPAELLDLRSLQRFVSLDRIEEVDGLNNGEFDSLTIDNLLTRLNELLLHQDLFSCESSILREIVYYAEKDATFFGAISGLGLSNDDLMDNVQLATTIIERAVSQYAAQPSLTLQILLSSLLTIVQRLLPYCVAFLDAHNVHKLFGDLLEASRRARSCSLPVGIQHALNGLLIQISFGVDSIVFFDCLSTLVTSSSWLRKPLLRLLQAFVDRKVYKTKESPSIDHLLKIVGKCEKLINTSTIFSTTTIESHTLLVRLIYKGLGDIYGDGIIQEVLEQVAPHTILLYSKTTFVESAPSVGVLPTPAATNLNENIPPANNEVLKDVISAATESDEKVLALVNDITVSRDKSASIRELYLFQKRVPTLDIEKYLDKLSSTFRRYVLEEFARLDLQEQSSTHSGQLSSADANSEGVEALRIIETLKSSRPVMSFASDLDTSVDTSADTVPDLSMSKRLSRSFSGASPFARRNEKIRDSLNNLSRTLELPNFDGETTVSQSLEERLNLLKAMK
jgi:cytoskeleton-associated protein 5